MENTSNRSCSLENSNQNIALCHMDKMMIVHPSPSKGAYFIFLFFPGEGAPLGKAHHNTLLIRSTPQLGKPKDSLAAPPQSPPILPG